jgi:outer membrane protein assembly factor BamB
MKSAGWRAIVFVGCLTLLGAGRAAGQDWPQWRGVNRDAKATGFKAPATWPKSLTQKWKVTVGNGVATPALVGDKLYVFARRGDDEVTACLDANTGKELWTDKYPAKPATGAASQFPGPRSSPTVADGRVVTFGVRGNLSCLDATTGKEVWRKDDFPNSQPRFFTSSSPILADGLCIAQLGGEEKGGIVAFELANGHEKWRWTDDGTAYASPDILTVDGVKMLVAITARDIVGVGAADGKLFWKIPYTVGMGGYNATTPIVSGDIVYISGSFRGTMAVKVEKHGETFATKELWKNPELSMQFSTPVLKDDMLYGISSRDFLFCENAKTGKTAWTNRIRGQAQRGYGSVVDVGPVLLALPPSAQLLVFEPTDKEYKQIARYKVADEDTYAYPVAAGNRIYIKDYDSLILWTVE